MTILGKHSEGDSRNGDAYTNLWVQADPERRAEQVRAAKEMAEQTVDYFLAEDNNVDFDPETGTVFYDYEGNRQQRPLEAWLQMSYMGADAQAIPDTLYHIGLKVGEMAEADHPVEPHS